MSDREIQLNDPQTLYRHWEDSQWNPFAIDLSADREQWAAMGGDDREPRLLGALVADGRRGADHDEVLGARRRLRHRGGGDVPATQQVDEARHMQFYARFQDEVVAAPATVAAHVERAREEISPAFRRIFDEALVEAHERLVAEPGDPHGEGPLRDALPPDPREHARTDDVQVHHRLPRTARGCCRASSTGYSKIHHDETRHIGYGVWFLRETVRADPEAGDDVRGMLRELLPSVAESLSPGADGDGPDVGTLGVEPEAIRDVRARRPDPPPGDRRRPDRDALSAGDRGGADYAGSVSARRVFPYLATLFAVLILAGVFILRPTPFIGVTAGAMADSLASKLSAGGTVKCEEAGEDEWTCETANASGGQSRTFDITVNGFGCWTATPAGGAPEVGTPATLTGCITLLDH